MAFNISYKFTVTDGFSRNIRKFRTALKKIGPVMDNVARKFANGARRMGAGLSRVQGKMRGLSLGIIAFGLVAGRSIFNFQKSMNLLEASTRGVTKKEMVQMRKAARDLGRTTEFTAGQVGQAMAKLGQSGFDAAENMEAIPSILSLASAGALDIAEASGIATSLLRGFGLETKETARIADILAFVASDTKTTVSQMGMAFSQVAAPARGLGVDIETTAAILAEFQDRGIRAMRASSGLKLIMLKLANVTKESAKVFRRMGISVKEVSTKIREGKVLELFEKMAKLGGGKLDVGLAGELFGTDAAISAITLADAVGNIRNRIRLLREEAKGTAKRMAEIQMKGIVGAVKRAISAFESFQLKLGKIGLTARFIQLADFIKEMSNRLENADPAWQRFAVNLSIIFLAATALIVPLAALATVAGGIAIAFAFISFPVFAVVTVVVLALAAALGVLLFRWQNMVAAFKERGFLAGVLTLLGADTEKSISIQRDLTIKLKKKFAEKGGTLPKDLVNPLAPPVKAEVKADVNVNVKVQAEPGTSVTSFESVIDGDVGFNLAGAQ